MNSISYSRNFSDLFQPFTLMEITIWIHTLVCASLNHREKKREPSWLILQKLTANPEPLVVLNGSMTIESNWFKTINLRTFILDLFIWDYIHLRPHLFEITFILHHVEVKLFWFTVNHIFMIYNLPLLLGRPEVLQGDYSFQFLQSYALPCPGVTHAGL